MVLLGFDLPAVEIVFVIYCVLVLGWVGVWFVWFGLLITCFSVAILLVFVCVLALHCSVVKTVVYF